MAAIFETYFVKKKESKNSIIFGLTALIGLIGFLVLRFLEFAIIDDEKISLGLLYLLFILMFSISSIVMTIRSLTKKQRDYQKLGLIKVGNSTLEIAEEIYSLESLQSLRFDYVGVNGDAISRSNFTDGSDNILYFKYNGKSFRYNFLLDNITHKNSYLDMLRSLYEERMNFIENHFLNGRTYLMNKLTYKEIKEFKEKYKL